jgi:hypothetical protein
MSRASEKVGELEGVRLRAPSNENSFRMKKRMR